MYVLIFAFTGILWSVLSIFYAVNGDGYMALEYSIMLLLLTILFRINEMDS